MNILINILVFVLGCLLSVGVRAAWPDDPFGSPMWAYNIERYLGSDARVVHDDRVNLRVPEFAEDSAQVPLTVDLSAFPEAPGQIVAWVDLNPVPHLFSASPGPQPLTLLALNFRVQQATTVRVAVQDREGVWHIGSRYVDAAGGGCTAPSQTMSNPDWERHFGTIRGGAFSRAEGMRYKVNVMHPMDSGMVGNIPAFFIGEVELRQGNGQPLLLSMALSESAAENPMFVFEFGQRPPQATLWLRDNNGNQFERRLGGDL